MVLRGSIYSNTLNMETGITVITPNNYGQAQTYRVCYVLHGLCGGNADFSNYTMLPLYAYDKDIIFICPEVQRSFYADMKYGLKYFTYICEELPQTIKLVFNVSARREDTAVMGCSMGGYGALKCALSRPQTFGFCGAFSAACLDMEEYFEKRREAGGFDFPDFIPVFGEEAVYEPSCDVAYLARRCAGREDKPFIFTCCGTEDTLLDENRKYASLLKSLGYSSLYEESDAGHDLYYFNEGIRRAIEIWGQNR